MLTGILWHNNVFVPPKPKGIGFQRGGSFRWPFVKENVSFFTILSEFLRRDTSFRTDISPARTVVCPWLKTVTTTYTFYQLKYRRPRIYIRNWKEKYRHGKNFPRCQNYRMNDSKLCNEEEKYNDKKKATSVKFLQLRKGAIVKPQPFLLSSVVRVGFEANDLGAFKSSLSHVQLPELQFANHSFG